MQRTLGGSRSAYSCNKCFLSIYYVPPTMIAFKIKIMKKAEVATACRSFMGKKLNKQLLYGFSA